MVITKELLEQRKAEFLRHRDQFIGQLGAANQGILECDAYLALLDQPEPEPPKPEAPAA